MEIDKVFSSDVDGVADNLFSAVKNSVSEIKAMQQRKAAENVQLVIQALKKIESDLQDKFDGVTTVIEKRVTSLKDGRDGLDGRNGRDGKDGRPGRDGAPGARGPAGVPGTNGRDGEDGVSVTDARIDFDGSLIISLSSGREINVGEVVAPDLAEKIKVITNGGGTSQGVLDSLASLQAQITALQNLGAVNYVGTWNASTNTPTIVNGTGDKGDYYVVSVAGSTNIDGQTLWGVGDWIIFNGTVWQRVDGGSTGDFTNLSASGTVTLSGGTANGVAYLNGSKVLTTGSALTFDGTNLLNDQNIASPIGIRLRNGSTSTSAGTRVVFEFSGSTTGYVGNQFDGVDFNAQYMAAQNHIWLRGSSEQMRLTSSGLGIGTTSPTYRLDAQTTATGTAAGDNTVAFFGSLASGRDANIRFGDSVNANARIGYLSGNLYFYTNGAERMRLDLSGNVGIGTSLPNGRLTVGGYSSANQTPDIQITRSSSGTAIQTGPNITFGDGTTNNTTTLQVTQGRFGVWNYGAGVWNERMSIDSAGNLLVGTTTNTNSSRLVVNGTISETVGGVQYPVVSQADIGTAANEIPLNQYLGALAYEDTETPALDVGTGITTGVGTICKANGGSMGGIYRMTILIDLTGLNSGGTAGDIIGVNGTALPCYIARLPAMTVLGGRMTCLETPAGGDTDIDLYSATEGTGVEDQAISALTETEIINAGAQTRGTVTYFSADPAANSYFYLVGQGTANNTYTAGRFLIEIFGVQ